MSLIFVPVWKEAPFIRLVVPFIIGIVVQWYTSLPAWVYWIILPLCIILIVGFAFYASFIKYQKYWITGAIINVLMAGMGGTFTYYKDIRHHPNWINHVNHREASFVVSLEEPITEKPNSFSVIASIDCLCTAASCKKTKGNLILYFQKDTSCNKLQYNTRIAFSKPLQDIRNTGNPGAFDYERYCAFQDIYHQVYLKPGEYRIVPSGTVNRFLQWQFRARERVVLILRENIHGKKEAGLAEALLIGYKHDLDKGLLQLYSKTGVVHVIAISGLHLGLIYWLLTKMLGPFGRIRRLRWIKPFVLITGLWAFSFLAGGSASVLRSAVMFSFIVLGENFRRETSIYNSLAGSAFLLLCFNPFWLWDAGFQLSYIAVLSIVIFMRPVYYCFITRNKILDQFWKLTALTTAAQVLTTPVSMYHFHQFPVYFLISNLVAVPLSGLILLGEILLCCISAFSPLASWTGVIIQWLIQVMNGFIEHMESLPFTTIENLLLSEVQLLLLYGTIMLSGCWLLLRNSRAFILALSFLGLFIIARSISIIQASIQKKLIIYHVPRHQAIDLIQGRKYVFLGDPDLYHNEPLQQFHLKPSRILHRVEAASSFPSLKFFREGLWFSNKRILVISSGSLSIGRKQLDRKTRCKADLVIITGNPKLNMAHLLNAVDCKQVVFDATNSAWKIRQWKADCEKFGISGFSVAEKGAFIINLN